MIKNARLALFGALALSVAACSPNVDTRGHLHQETTASGIVPGYTTRDGVLEMLGSPSSRSSFGEETWYYITTRRESYGFLRPEVTERDTVAIVFGPDGMVSDIRLYDGSEAQDVDYATRKTPTEGHEMTVSEQLLGNIGRFNGPGRAGALPNPNRGRGPTPF